MEVALLASLTKASLMEDGRELKSLYFPMAIRLKVFWVLAVALALRPPMVDDDLGLTQVDMSSRLAVADLSVAGTGHVLTDAAGAVVCVADVLSSAVDSVAEVVEDC